MTDKLIAFVIPVCNEQENVKLITLALDHVMKPLPYSYTITFVDDGSNDGSLQSIKQLATTNNHIKYISLARNFGHQNALKAGIDASDADCLICMDGDLQHPPSLIPTLLEEWEKGFDIVYTIRKDENQDAYLKKATSKLFYELLNRLSDIEIESGTADFRLMDRRVVDILKNFNEIDLFWRGLVKWIGFNQKGIEYEPATRSFGQSKYTYKKMLQFALRGITSFSTKPLTIAIYIGFIFSILSLFYVPYVIISMVWGHPVSGWASLIATIAFFGGMQLMILGIIGMYLGKLFMQSKQRPHYIVNETNIK